MLLIEKGLVLIVVITDAGVVRNKRMKVDESIGYEVVDSISDFLSAQLAGAQRGRFHIGAADAYLQGNVRLRRFS